MPARYGEEPENPDGDHWQDTQKITKLTADVDDLQRQLSHAERIARDTDRELDEYKERVARALGWMARGLINVDLDVGDLALNAMRDLDD